MLDETELRHFELTLWPHLRAAYNVARWLVRDSADAEDIVQEAYLKAFQSIGSFRGGDARVWLLAIVRNSALNLIRRRKSSVTVEWPEKAPEPEDQGPGPEHELIAKSRREQLRQAIARLAPEFRETLVLREIEGLAYKEIASVLNVPIGTVMSRLARARQLLLVELGGRKEVSRP